MTDYPTALAAARECLDNEGHRATDALRDLLAAIDAARGETRQKVKDTLTDYLDHYPHPELLDAVMAQFVTAAPPAALAVPSMLPDEDKARTAFWGCYPDGDSDKSKVWMTAYRWCRAVLAAPAPPAARANGMLPAALVPHAKEWYRLCERRFAVDHITISGKLAEAIVAALAQRKEIATLAVPAEWPLHDRVEFALRDAGFDYDEASRIAILATARKGE